MIYFYATVTVVGTVGKRTYAFLVKAKDISNAKYLVETDMDFKSYVPDSIHICVSRIGSMVMDNSVQRIYLDKKN